MIGSKAVKQDYIFQHLSFASKSFLIKQKHIIEIIERQMDMADPERILKLGYSITRINGKAIFAANDLKIGDMLQTTLFDGEIQSVVKEKHDNKTT